MSTGIVTLTTDFGTGSHYAAQMKGVLLSAARSLQIVDVTHSIPAFSVRHAEVVLRAVPQAFPLGTVHVVIVDPGVGTTRRPIAMRAAGMTFVGPDNGVLGAFAAVAEQIVVLDRPHLFRQPVAPTFHGRDLFAPVAAELALGLPLSEVGTPVTDFVPSTLPKPQLAATRVVGVTLFADDFGNLLTNIPVRAVAASARIEVGGRRVRRVATYGEATPGELVALGGSDGFVEIAVREGSAALELSSRVGLQITCEQE